MKKELLLAFAILAIGIHFAPCQGLRKKKVAIKKEMEVILKDTTFITKNDTVLLLSRDEIKSLRIKESPYLISSQFYDSLSERASASKFTKDIFDLVVRKRGRKEVLVNRVIKSEDTFKPFTDYTIESIVFKTVDLLEGSVIDTLQKATTRLGKFVNKVHRDTRAIIIQQNLLFQVGDRVDPYRLADNERVLRQFKTLKDARIYVARSKTGVKSVDVVVVTQDVTSIGVGGSYSSLEKFRLDLFDINILGYARQLRLSYFRNSADSPKNGYEVTLREPNFLKSFMQGELQYTENYVRQRTRIALGRDFFTPEIKYAGGIELYRTHENFYFEEFDTLKMSYTENNIDLWAGRSFEFKKRNNLIFSARINPRSFVGEQFVSVDSNSFFYDRMLLLGSVSLTKRNFLKSLRIRGFGKTEDIPTGGSLSAIAGKEFNQFTDRVYFELDGTFGRYLPSIGYINFGIAAGSFFKDGAGEDGLVATTSTYFSDLIKVNKMQVRQFIFFTYTRGFNRVLDQTISLKGKWRNDEALHPLGNKRITLGFETVYFMPWYTYGFQFALFHRFDLNLISTDSGNLLGKKSLFPSLRTGVRILNENLVLPTFSIDVAYFGSNPNYNSGWEVKISTTLPNLFGTSHVFKPRVTEFN